MCTVIVASRVSSQRPLWIAANRDEFLSRPSAAPTLTTQDGVTVFAPVDLVAGGTWIGANSEGLVVAVTNRAGLPPDKSRVSRGMLVHRALRHRSLAEAEQEVAALAETQYNPFHLILADSERVTLFVHDGNRIAQQSLPAGIHVVTERSLSSDAAQREIWLRSQLAGMDLEDEVAIEQLLRSHHGTDPISSVCIHVPSLGYGTRSSSIISVRPSERLLQYRFAEGPPCQSEFRMQSLPLRK